jgi:cysteine-rich repeat protein
MLPDDSSSSGDGPPPLDLGAEGGCGNAVVELGEVCDDGNLVPGDGCEADCTSSDDVPTEFFLTMGGPNGFADCGTGVAFDSAGNVIFAGLVAGNVWIRKYDTAYQELWTVTYPGQMGWSNVVAVDSQDNIAFAGAVGTIDNRDWIVGLLDPEGGELWSTTYDGPVMRSDAPQGIAVDSQDAIIVVGDRENPMNGLESAIFKFANDGTLLWSDFAGPKKGALAVDTDVCDAILVSSFEYGDKTDADIVVTKYDADGGLVWKQVESTPTTDWAFGIGVDGRGRSVVAGAVLGDRGLASDVWARQYASAGDEGWTVSFDGGANATDNFLAVTVAANGESWAVGGRSPSTNHRIAFAVKFDPAGEIVWSRDLDLIGGPDGWLAVARAADGRVGLAGCSSLAFPNDDEAHFAVYPP